MTVKYPPPPSSVSNKLISEHQSQNKPTREQVAAKAYAIYQQRLARNEPGDSAADWIKAERELTTQR